MKFNALTIANKDKQMPPEAVIVVLGNGVSNNYNYSLLMFLIIFINCSFQKSYFFHQMKLKKLYFALFYNKLCKIEYFILVLKTIHGSPTGSSCWVRIYLI